LASALSPIVRRIKRAFQNVSAARQTSDPVGKGALRPAKGRTDITRARCAGSSPPRFFLLSSPLKKTRAVCSMLASTLETIAAKRNRLVRSLKDRLTKRLFLVCVAGKSRDQHGSCESGSLGQIAGAI
jgi:hypothetical protein